MIIRKTDNYQVTQNFNISEFFTDSPGVAEHFLHDDIPQVAQIVRDHYGVPVIVSDSFRTNATYLRLLALHEEYKDTPKAHLYPEPSSTSKHFDGIAVDLKFGKDRAKYQALFNKDMRQKGELYQKLKAAGVRGIGIYSRFFHLDFRSQNRMSFWDDAKKK